MRFFVVDLPSLFQRAVAPGAERAEHAALLPSGVQGPAHGAADSLQAVAKAREQRHYMSEPAHTITQGRPTKRDRRELDRQSRPDWNERWSASLD